MKARNDLMRSCKTVLPPPLWVMVKSARAISTFSCLPVNKASCARLGQAKSRPISIPRNAKFKSHKSEVLDCQSFLSTFFLRLLEQSPSSVLCPILLSALVAPSLCPRCCWGCRMPAGHPLAWLLPVLEAERQKCVSVCPCAELCHKQKSRAGL